MSVSAVIDQALDEFRLWDGRDESDPRMEWRLVEYWQSVLGKHPEQEFGRNWKTALPWSAAFISFTVNSRAPGALPPARSHWEYARDSISGQRGEYVALDPRAKEAKVRVGDILVKNRSGSQMSFQDLQRVGFSPSHGDIVVNITDGGRTAVGIGGNVGSSVGVVRYALDAEGRASNVITVLRYLPTISSETGLGILIALLGVGYAGYRLWRN